MKLGKIDNLSVVPNTDFVLRSCQVVIKEVNYFVKFQIAKQ